MKKIFILTTLFIATCTLELVAQSAQQFFTKAQSKQEFGDLKGAIEEYVRKQANLR